MALPPPARQRQIIANAAAKFGIDPSILFGVYGAETNFGQNVNTSGAGAVGPFQFMPSTAAARGVDPLNFRSAAFGAAKYLSDYKDRGVPGMLAAYNAGPAGNPNNPETQAYIPKVQQLAQQWSGQKPTLASGSGGVPQQQLVTRNVFDRQGFEQDQKKFQLGQILQNAKSPFQEYGPKGGISPSNPLLSVLPSTEPAENDYVKATLQLQRLAGGTRLPVHGLAAGAPGEASRALSFAAHRLGTTETTGANRGPKIDDWQRSFGLLGQPWCGVFVGKALQQAGVKVDSRIASTAAIVDMARQGTGGFKGLVSAGDVQPGDVAVWDPGPSGHTGIVERVRKDGTIVTIEGNASNSVRREIHPTQNAFYARPAYRR